MTSRAWRLWPSELRPPARSIHTSNAGRRILTLAFTFLVALAATACHGISRPRPLGADYGVLGMTTPALSVAGSAAFRCVDTRARGLLPARLERSSRGPLLELGVHDSIDPDFQAGLGRVIVRQFGCTRYTIEVAVPVPSLEVVFTPLDMIKIGNAMSDDGGVLWSIAEVLRLSEREPFVYGTVMELSEDASVSLRLDAKGSSARLMLVYKLGL